MGLTSRWPCASSRPYASILLPCIGRARGDHHGGCLFEQQGIHVLGEHRGHDEHLLLGERRGHLLLDQLLHGDRRRWDLLFLLGHGDRRRWDLVLLLFLLGHGDRRRWDLVFLLFLFLV